MNVKIENLASEIMKGLEEYSDMATDEVKKEVKKAGSNIRKDIQENAPVGETKKYSKSWSVKTIKESSNSIELVVHSRNRYQLAHLLEKAMFLDKEEECLLNHTLDQLRRKESENWKKI